MCLGDEIGRLARLKILCAHARAGSSPARGTTLKFSYAKFSDIWISDIAISDIRKILKP